MILWIDTETGGLDEKINPVLTLGFAITDDEYNIIYKNELKVKNKHNLKCEDGALNVNRINLINHDKVAKDPAEVALLFNRTIKKHFRGTPTIAGHNINFDLKFIKEMYIREGLEFKSSRYLDTLQLFRFFENWGLIKPESSKMDSLIKYFKIKSLGKKHSALVDVINNIKIVKILKNLTQVKDLEKYLKSIER